MSISQIVLGVFGAGHAGLIIGEIIGRLFGNLRLFKSVKYDFKKYLTKFIFKKILSVGMEYRNYPLYTAPSWFLNNSTTHLVPLFIVYQYGIELAGLYFMAYKIMSIPELIISQSVNQAFTGRFSDMLRSNKGNPRELYSSTVKNLLVFSILSTPVLGIFLHYSFGYIFGTQWAYSGQLALYLIPLFIGQLTMSSMYVALNLLNQQKQQLAWDFFRFLMLLFLIVLTIVFDFELMIFVQVFGVIICASYIVLYYLTLRKLC